MLEFFKRRAFVIACAVFLVYGVSAMDGGTTGLPSADTERLPGLRVEFLRLRDAEESLEPVADPFVAGEPIWEEIEPFVQPLNQPPAYVLVGAPLPGGLLPESADLAVVEAQAPEKDKERGLWGWPEDFLLTLDATMTAAGTASARVNGKLMTVGDKIVLVGQELLLESVEGTTAVLTWRGRRIRLDLLERPSVESSAMPIDG